MQLSMRRHPGERSLARYELIIWQLPMRFKGLLNHFTISHEWGILALARADLPDYSPIGLKAQLEFKRSLIYAIKFTLYRPMRRSQTEFELACHIY